MPLSVRRAIFTILPSLCLPILIPFGQSPHSQAAKQAPAIGKGDASKNTYKLDDGFAIGLPTDDRLQSLLDAATENIRDKNWAATTDVLQKLVNLKEDVFAKLVRKTADGKNTQVWTSVRSEANIWLSQS